MNDKLNTYSLRTEVSDGAIHYFVCFKDGQGVFHETEVTEDVFHVFSGFQKQDKRQQNFFDRHVEHSDLSDELLNKRTAHHPKTIEEIITDAERKNALQKAIADLSEVQRRRFILYYEKEFTYEQIAEMEGCSHPAVIKSVKAAKEKIIKYLSEQGYN